MQKIKLKKFLPPTEIRNKNYFFTECEFFSACEHIHNMYFYKFCNPYEYTVEHVYSGT